MNFIVIENWKATYTDPIRLAAGESIYLTGRQDNWDGHIWLWARSANGLEGWILDSLVCQGEVGPFAKEEYTAIELTCQVGQVLVGEKETHGWVYCRSAAGSAGWVPRKNLALAVA
ncbi:SH3 domain-containing protein [Acidocella sp. MX-AZ02]|uniref:SH3 domain-containing protein n=1 Tax=unclassified Acidocella TaxID=2648610 RepID=UPI00028D7D56|nr:SH3 domain-containing protein [Acidocella sp. MX-AZ02]EKM98223.1 SH3 domain-containing protein [Acidocella sp. MX-AZ02]